MTVFWRCVLLVVGAAVLAAVVARTGGALVLRMLWQIGWGFLAMTVLRVGYVALRAAALWRTVPPGGPSFRDLWWIRLSTEAVEAFTLTGPFLAEPAKGWLLTRRGLSTAQAVGLVGLEYLLYTMVTAWMAATSLALLLMRGALPNALRSPVVAILVAIALVTAGFLYATVSGIGLIAPVVRRLGALFGSSRVETLSSRLDASERILVGFLKGDRRGLFAVLLMQAAAQALIVLEAWIVFRAVGEQTTLGGAFVFEGAIKFIDVAFFFVPGQLGAHEGLYGVAARALSMLPAAGVTLALARRIRGVLVGAAAAFARLDLKPSAP